LLVNSLFGTNFKLAELIRYLFPVPPSPSVGPSLNTCPKWTPSTVHETSAVSIPPDTSVISYIILLVFGGICLAGLMKLGQPVPESYLSLLEKSISSLAIDLYKPSHSLSK